MLAHMADPPYPSIADALWLSCSVPTYLGLFLLLRARGTASVRVCFSTE